MNEHRITRTRNRVPLSCVACRVRKLKCNREKPCQNCIVRGDVIASACSYASAANPKSAGSKGARPTPIDMRGRIDRLETLVRSLISQEDESCGLDSPKTDGFGEQDPGLAGRSSKRNQFALESGNSDETERSNETPHIAGGQKISIDTRSTHWDAILHDITEIRNAWGDEEDAQDEDYLQKSAINFRPGILRGLARPPDVGTMLASLPPRSSTDKLIERFFEIYNPAMPVQFVIHKPTFFKRYNQHWQSPTKTKIIWVGLLFSILCFAMHSYENTDEEPLEFRGTSKVLADLYRTRAAQCIIAADITKPTDYMIEALFIYSFIDYYDQADGDVTVWMISGLMMRLALKQGYHRDPSQHPDVSPFQAEMRRRLWMIVHQLELLFAVQLGLPKTIRYAECDTAPPRNTYEEELDEDMKNLPPDRPETEPTPMSYYLSKMRILRAYGYVIEHLHIVEEQPYESVMRLDARLIESRNLIPPHLRLQPDDKMRYEQPGLLMEKYTLEHFYLKAICILHRKYLNCSLADDAHAYSRRSCIVSAMELLRQQESLDSECQPGGRLERIKWYRFSLIKHDFLLAAMVLCLAIYNDERQSRSEGRGQFGEIGWDQRLEIFAALQRGKQIWADVACNCADSKRAVTILTAVLDKLGMNELQRENGRASLSIENPKLNDFSRTATNYSQGFSVPIHSNAGPNEREKIMDSSSAPSADANTSGNINSTKYPPESAYDDDDAVHDNLFITGGIFNSFEPDLNVPANLDWAAWDHYINRANHLDSPQDDLWSNEYPFLPSDMTPYM